MKPEVLDDLDFVRLFFGYQRCKSWEFQEQARLIDLMNPLTIPSSLKGAADTGQSLPRQYSSEQGWCPDGTHM